MVSLTQRLAGIQQQLARKSSQPLTAPFGEWMPDLADFQNPGITEAKNVIPTADGYRPFPGLSAFSNALDNRSQGAGAGVDTAGTVTIYAGDEAKLYRLVGSTFTDASQPGGYATAGDGGWEFVQFGKTMIATNLQDAVQSVTVGQNTYADLITSSDKPKAQHIDIVREFIVLGNTNDATDGRKPNRVWWSGIGDATDFAPSASTQSDYQDIQTGGSIQRVIGGVDYGLIFLEREIHRMSYVGSPLVWRFDPIDRKRGTPIPGSVIGFGRFVFFISDEGFFLSDGSQSIPIGQNKVDQFFWDQLDTVYFSRVSAAVDPVQKMVWWSFPGTGSSAGQPNKLLGYQWVDKRWAHVDLETQIIARLFERGYTLDTIDAVSDDLDALPLSLDSAAWTGGGLEMVAFDTDKKMALFEGSNLEATLETTEFTLGPGRSKLRSHRPLVDTSSVTVAVASRVRQADPASFGSAASLTPHGMAPARSEGRYHRDRLTIAAGATWTRAQGVEVIGAPTGVK
jgi:hypothetical protein